MIGFIILLEIFRFIFNYERNKGKKIVDNNTKFIFLLNEEYILFKNYIINTHYIILLFNI